MENLTNSIKEENTCFKGAGSCIDLILQIPNIRLSISHQ